MADICVFASSSHKLEASYYTLAREVGRALAKAGAGMVFGGGRIGMMGAAAEGVMAEGGRLIGVIPVKLNQPGIAFEHCTELIETATMHERKQTMERLSAGFIALPGGFGTAEELLEVITLKQLGYHDRPIVVMDHQGFYGPLLEQFEVYFREGLAHPDFRALYQVAHTAEEAVALALSEEKPVLPDKIAEAARQQ